MARNNTDISVDRNKIRELCTAFEVEYAHYSAEKPDENISKLVDMLKETVKTFRKQNPDVFDEGTYSNIYSSIGFIGLSARNKIEYIYEQYATIIDDGFKRMLWMYPLNLSEEQTANDIGWLVKSRNSITHAKGINDSEIPNAIFARLKVAVFCSALNRASYSYEEISSIMKSYFDGTFKMQ